MELLRTCLSSAPPLSSPHKDGWRNEHLAELARDATCRTALARVLTAMVAGDVPLKTADILSSATLIIMLKKDATTMEEMKL